MLSEKSWRLEPVTRLFMSVLLCIFIGSLVLAEIEPFKSGARPGWKFLTLGITALGLLTAALVMVRKPWRIENFRSRAVALLVLFYAGMLVGGLAQSRAGSEPAPGSTLDTLIRILAFQGAALVWVAGFLREHQVSWTSAFGLSNQGFRAVLIGITVACFFLPIAWGLQTGFVRLITHLPRLALKPEEQLSVQVLRQAFSWFDRAVLGIATIALAPVAEEILFRGILYPAIKRAGFKRLALWGTALLFAAIHVNLETFIPLFALAIVLTVLYEKTNNLLAPITAHAAFNALNFASLYMLQEQMGRG